MHRKGDRAREKRRAKTYRYIPATQHPIPQTVEQARSSRVGLFAESTSSQNTNVLAMKVAPMTSDSQWSEEWMVIIAIPQKIRM